MQLGTALREPAQRIAVNYITGPNYSFTRHVLRSYIHKFIPAFIPLFFPLLIRSIMQSFIDTFIPSFVHSFVNSYKSSFFHHSCIHSFMCLFVRPSVAATIRSFIPTSTGCMRALVPTPITQSFMRTFCTLLRTEV